ncbi:MAG: carbohydrate-binding family 9-like protein [Prevotellaceae bacterium]|nr:carbohydrate-binding family 9-like protein [Prevotellaceae bacterium]
MKQLFIIFLTTIFTFIFADAQNADNVKYTVCHKASEKIKIDGYFDESAWEKTEWIDDFEDIRGGGFPEYKTQVKMLWDDDFLYLAIKFEDPHICAFITENEKQIYLDNAFELFIDPDGDAHDYYEFEINAAGATWDLQMDKPYSRGGNFNSNWTIDNIRKAIFLNGTLNNPTDIDSFWTIELAMPFAALDEYSDGKHPDNETKWRLNFLRVQWNFDIVDGKYVKKTDDKGKSLRSDLWVWSPQKQVNMHIPERWGIVEFKKESLNKKLTNN